MCWKPCAATGATLAARSRGNVILSDLATTGDGVIAALQVLAVLLGNRRHKASEAFRLFDPVPQVRRDIVFASQAAAEACLASAQLRSVRTRVDGLLKSVPHRVLVRASGTEPLLRVMVECQDKARGARAASLLQQEAQSQAKTKSKGTKSKGIKAKGTKSTGKAKAPVGTKATGKAKAKGKGKATLRAKAKAGAHTKKSPKKSTKKSVKKSTKKKSTKKRAKVKKPKQKKAILNPHLRFLWQT